MTFEGLALINTRLVTTGERRFLSCMADKFVCLQFVSYLISSTVYKKE